MKNLQYLNEVKIILNAFEDSGITPSQFLQGLLVTTGNILEDHPTTLSIIEDLDFILDTLKYAPATSTETTQWLFRSAEKEYQVQVLRLTHKDASFRFHPGKTTSAQLAETKIENLGRQMEHLAPDLWRLLASL